MVEDLAKIAENRINWDNHEKLNVLTTADAIMISYKNLESSNPDHQILKKLFKPQGNEQILLEIEMMPYSKQRRKNMGRSLKFMKDGSIDYQGAPEHFLFERIAACVENQDITQENKEDKNILLIEKLCEDFDHGYKINIGKI